MHPLRALREGGPPSLEQVAALLAENVVFNRPLLVRPIEGRDAVARTIVQSARNRDGVGTMFWSRSSTSTPRSSAGREQSRGTSSKALSCW